MSALCPSSIDIEFAAHIGIDWADQKHAWSMRTADGKLHRGELDNTPEAVHVWAAELERRFDGRPVAVALEQARGAVVAMLCKYAHLVLFPIHPNTLTNYRKAFTPSGAKSDPRDADLALELLVHHPERLQRLAPDTVETRKLQFLTEQRRQLVNQHSTETQRLISWLKQVFPQILQWFDDPACALVGTLLLRWPSLPALQKVRPGRLRKFFHTHNCRDEERIEQRLQQIRQAVSATNDPALLQTATLAIETSVRLLESLREGIAKFDAQIEETYQEHPDRFIMESLPGAGAALEPRLIAALGSRRERFESAEQVARYTGIAPVTESSGTARWIHWRWACPKFLRQTFHEWAGCSIRTCRWAREHYDRQRDKGKGHHAALRSVAFKWIRILYRCWRDRVPYSESLYLQARAARNRQPQPAAVQLQWKICGGLHKPSLLPS